MTADRQLAQDIAQEVFWRLHRHHQAHPEAPVTPEWLYTVTRNLVRDVWRRQRLIERPLDGASWATTDSVESQVATRLAVQQALMKLTPMDRACLWLFYYEDWSLQQIAEGFRIPESRVRTRVFRARQRFAKIWGEMPDARP